MTRLEAFKILFPEATLDSNGYPLNTIPCEVAPCVYQGEVDCPVECKENFWDEEVKFKFVEE